MYLISLLALIELVLLRLSLSTKKAKFKIASHNEHWCCSTWNGTVIAVAFDLENYTKRRSLSKDGSRVKNPRHSTHRRRVWELSFTDSVLCLFTKIITALWCVSSHAQQRSATEILHKTYHLCKIKPSTHCATNGCEDQRSELNCCSYKFDGWNCFTMQLRPRVAALIARCGKSTKNQLIRICNNALTSAITDKQT